MTLLARLIRLFKSHDMGDAMLRKHMGLFTLVRTCRRCGKESGRG